MILLKNSEQIAGMRKAGALLYEVLQTLKEEVRPGMTTMDLNLRADELIRKGNAVPSFLNYNGFPASLCTSVNDVVVHGIPSETDVLKEGDIISLDCGLVLEGWQADSALTVPVGKVSKAAEKLIEALTAQGHETLFVGGTALYLQAMMHPMGMGQVSANKTPISTPIRATQIEEIRFWSIIGLSFQLRFRHV